MKKFILAVFLISQIVLKSQTNLPFYETRATHWGFTFGLNYSGYNLFKNQTFVDSNYYIAIEGKANPGFLLGPVLNIKIAKYLDIRFLINISFTERSINYFLLDKENSTTKTTIKIPSSYIEMPVLFKYKAARIKNLAPYIIFGVNAKYDIATTKKIDFDQPHLKISPFDFQFELGPGLDFYLPYFKFSIELKYGNGINNILDPEQTIFASPLEAIKTNCFYLSFHFEG